MTLRQDLRASGFRFAVLLLCVVFAARNGAAQPLAGRIGARSVGTVAVKALDEISGLAASRKNPGVLWVHDDGDIDSIFAVRTSGEAVARLSWEEELEDCEDMAWGPGPDDRHDYLYLADIGDNDAERETITIVRLIEPLLGPDAPDRLDAEDTERLTLTYPDGPHDAEALLVEPLSSDLLIVTKEDNLARVYRAPAASWNKSRPIELEHVLTLGFEKVSAGDISHDGQWIALRREEEGRLWRREEGQDLLAVLRGPAVRIAVLGTLQDDNGEAIAFHPNGVGYYTVSEGKRQPIYFFPLP